MSDNTATKASGRKQPKKTAQANKFTNPVIEAGVSVPNVEQVTPSMVVDVVRGTEIIATQPAPGLGFLQRGEKSAVPVEFQKFPLAISKTGRWTGRLMSIGDFCLAKRGKAFNQAQADAYRVATGKAIAVVSKEEKDSVSAELDAIRGEFWRTAKMMAVALHSREDVKVQGLSISKTTKGFRINTSALLETKTVSEAEILRQQVAAQALEIEELKKHVPKNIAKKAAAVAHDKLEHVIEASASVTPQPAVGEPAAKPAEPAEGSTSEAK